MLPEVPGQPLDVVAVGDWEPLLRQLCPKAQVDPVPCDCGYIGAWDLRSIYGWHTYDERPQSYSDAALKQVGGWKVNIGFDERCPGCGDIERFDNDANLCGRLVESAPWSNSGASDSGPGPSPLKNGLLGCGRVSLQICR